MIPVLAATIVPTVLALATAYALRGQSGRRSAGLIVRVPAGWNPLTARERDAIRHYAGRDRNPYTGGAR